MCPNHDLELMEATLARLKEIRRTISSGDIKTALNQLDQLLSGTRLHNEVIVHMARHRRLEEDERRGLLTRDQADAQKNRLTDHLLRFVDDVSKARAAESSLRQSLHPETEPDSGDVSSLSASNAEHVLGSDNLKGISWPAQAAKVARSVCRVIRGGSTATGFLVAPGLLMTNRHVIDSAEIAAATVIEFNYQVGSDGRMEPTARYRLMADTYFAGNRQSLDYCLVRVLPDHRNPPIISWNYLPINPHADPIVQERVIIVQHPNGGPKQIAMTHNQVLEVREPNLRYTTDTLPGSSGSPVFNESWQVIAIHCRRTPLKTPAGQPARFVNEGTLMSSIQADAGLRLPTIPHEPMSP